MSCKWIDVCPLRRYEEQGKLDIKWKEQYCEKDYEKCKRFIAEEKGIYHSNNMLPNGEIDENLK